MKIDFYVYSKVDGRLKDISFYKSIECPTAPKLGARIVITFGCVGEVVRVKEFEDGATHVWLKNDELTRELRYRLAKDEWEEVNFPTR